MQLAQIVGVGGKGMDQPVFRFDFRRQHRAGVDAPALGRERPPSSSKDCAELAFADRGDLTDPLQLILVQPLQHVLRHPGQQRQRVRRQEQRLAPPRHQHRPGSATGPAPAFLEPPHPGRGLGDQLVDRCPDGERNPEPVARFPPDPLGDIRQRTEQPLGAAQIEKGVTVPARLDDWGVDPENFVERPRRPGIEPGIGRNQNQVGAELPGLADQHSPPYSGGLRFGRERQDGRAVGPRRGDGEGAAPERRGHHPLDRRDECRWINEKDSPRHVPDFGICSGNLGRVFRQSRGGRRSARRPISLSAPPALPPPWSGSPDRCRGWPGAGTAPYCRPRSG
jgi:hypothetical protein